MARKESHQFVALTNVKHQSILSREVSQFWRERKLCDLQVTVNDRVFDCHSIVLAACSNYFRSRILKMTENLNIGITRIDLTSVCCEKTFELILDFIYTGDVFVPVDVFESFLNESKIFEIEGLTPAIDTAFSPEIVTIENIVSLLLKSYKMKIDSLQVYCIDFVCNNFQELASRNDFLELTDEILRDIVIRDELIVDTEDDILDAVLLWANHWPSERARHLVDIIKSLRLGLLNVSTITKLIRHPLIRINPEALDFTGDLLEYLSGGKTRSYNFQVSHKERFKVEGNKIIIAGGIIDDDVSDDVQAYDIKERKWQRLADLPQPLSRFGSAVIDDDLYVVGGLNATSKAIKSVYCYDPVENKWSEKQSMSIPRQFHGLAAVGKKLFAIGGYTSDTIDSMTNSVECYDVDEDTWLSVKDLQEALARQAVCSSSNGKYIYCFGGRRMQDTNTNEIRIYDVFNDKWSDGGVLFENRYCGSAACVNDRIFIFGGYCKGKLSTVEEYLPKEKVVAKRERMLVGRSEFSAHTLDNMIYVLGGWNEDKGAFYVDAFDVSDEHWLRICQLERKRSGYGGSILKFKSKK